VTLTLLLIDRQLLSANLWIFRWLSKFLIKKNPSLNGLGFFVTQGLTVT